MSVGPSKTRIRNQTDEIPMGGETHIRPLAALLVLAALSGCQPHGPPMPAGMREEPGVEGFNARAVVDRSRREVVVWAGPFHVQPGTGGHAHGSVGSGNGRSPVIPIEWPADGYIHGFALELRDGDGNRLARSLMHHLIAVNFDRRMFAYPVAERLFGIGTETGDVGLIAPDDKSRWPEADPHSEIWALDLSGLPEDAGVMTRARDVLATGGGR